MDPADLVRNPDSIQGLQAPPALPQEDNNYFLNSENQRQPLILTEPAPAGSSGGSNTVISVPQPVIAGIPEVPPAGASASNAPARPAAQTAPAAAAPVPDVPAPAAAPAPAAQAAPPAAAQPTPAARPPSAPAVPPRPKVSTPAARSTPVASRTTKATVQPLAGRNNYWVQTGSFSTKTRAEGAKDMLAAKGITPIIENRDVNGKTFFRVRVGPYTSQNEADYWLALIKNISGFEESQIWISQSRP
ncbi:MAG: SPOR domain-containing protein [Treponema sp.]|nr:SPOR domain-containing protein [Treponema sp.]